MKKKLNRERLNVGKAIYSDRIKSILKNTKSQIVKNLLIEQIGKRATGDQCDEMGWIEISQMALNFMHEEKQVVYFTEKEVQTVPNVIENVKSDGYEVVLITEQQKAKLEQQNLMGSVQVRTVETYIQQFNTSFQYTFVEISNLSKNELSIFELTPQIASLIGVRIEDIPEIKISETMRVSTDDTEGVWDSSIPAIVIKRSKLDSLIGYASTLLHEIGHAMTGTQDSSRAFESVLTEYLGKIAVIALEKNYHKR